MGKRLFWLVLLVVSGFLAWHFGYQAAIRYFFRASGTVNVAPQLLGSLPGPDSMLFVMARNDSGITVAVKKVINPVFPAEFRMNSANLIMPDLLTRRLYFEARVNTHGQLNSPRKGDLQSGANTAAGIVSKGLEITLDTRIK
jgi:hypothetical protein